MKASYFLEYKLGAKGLGLFQLVDARFAMAWMSLGLRVRINEDKVQYTELSLDGLALVERRTLVGKAFLCR